MPKPLEQNNLTATYNGDANFTSSSGAAGSIDIVAQFPPFSITPSPATVNIASPGQSGSTVLTFAAQAGFVGSGMLTPAVRL